MGEARQVVEVMEMIKIPMRRKIMMEKKETKGTKIINIVVTNHQLKDLSKQKKTKKMMKMKKRLLDSKVWHMEQMETLFH